MGAEEPRMGMRASYRAIGFAHVFLGFLLAIGFIGSVYSFTELTGMAWDFKLFFHLSLFVSACLFALLQILVRDANARKLWVRFFFLGAHFTLGLYLSPMLLTHPIFDPHILIPLAFIVAVQLLDRDLTNIFGRIATLSLGIIISFIIIVIILVYFIDGFIGFVLPIFF